MKQLIFTILLISQSFFTKAQTESFSPCGTTAYMEHLVKKYPNSTAKTAEIERFTQKWIAAQKEQDKESVLITIPVVVHVVHTLSNPESNISDEKIHSQIDILNEDFRRLNADASNTLPVFEPVAADMEIEFCLAQRTPNGLPTTGINRIPTEKEFFVTNDDDVKFAATGGADIWDATRYLNIWICNAITNGGTATVLGYGQFPGIIDSPETDGIVVAYQTVGNIPPSSPGYTLGRTATHEVGHWLNLRHVWGNGFGCIVDDLVEDTPFQSGPSGGCPLSANTCIDSPIDYVDMVQNYMDYTDDDCKNLFTQGQKDRARAVLTQGGLRHSITLSNACEPIPIGATDAGLVSIIEPFGAGHCSNFSPIIEIRNLGTEELFYVNISYAINGGEPQTTFWNGMLPQFETTQHTLPPIAVTGSGVVHDITITLSEPNLQPDFNPDNDEQSTTFAVLTLGAAPPLSEGFEGVDFPVADWEVINQDASITFSQTNTAAHSGTHAVRIHNFNYPAVGAIDELILPDLDLTLIDNPALTFYQAYALTDATDTPETLEVLISTDCGESFSTLYQKTGNELSSLTSNVNYIPNVNEWRQETISLSPYSYVRNAMLVFRQTSGNGNNLYIDDINIDTQIIPIGIDEQPQTGILKLYPNPVTTKVLLDVENAENETVEFFILNKMGQKMKFSQTRNGRQISLEVAHFPQGIYFLKMIKNGVVWTERFVKL